MHALRLCFRVCLVVLEEAGRRLLGAPSFVSALMGRRPRRTLRLRILILHDPETNLPVVDSDVVRGWVDAADAVLKTGADVRLEAEVVEMPTPPNTLDMAAGVLAYFTRPLRALMSLHDRRAVAVTVVRAINGGLHTGFAYAVDRTILLSARANGATLAHELGHLGWLVHHPSADNVMHGARSDTKSGLNVWQAAWLRGSRLVG